MNIAAQSILDLLTYIEQVERLSKKPNFSVPTDYFVAHQHELAGLPEVRFNLQNAEGEVWLRLPRLKEIAAPDIGEILKPWATLPRDPEKLPELKTELFRLY